uniref:15-cis-phytoene synthase n=2 Tax=Diacronema lutheri TaxID=2081491 RepID=A0A2D2AGZ8_DIALT|nr:phytoene synthetase [Diacronema lutheri]
MRSLVALVALGLVAPSGSMRSVPLAAFPGLRTAALAVPAQPLRSRAVMIASTDTPLDGSKRSAALAEGYEVCRKITASYAKTFYLGTRFMAPPRARAIWAVYAWCRRTDDIVDAPRGGVKYLKREIAAWSARLERIWEGEAFDVVDLPLVETVKQYPTMSIQPYKDMIEGMLMDLKQDRYETFDDLHLYCYRVAGTVGLMTLPVMGTADGVTYEEAVEPALALGIALQLTNILRDVGEDARRGRIYLPKDELKRFGVSEEQVLAGVLDENYVRLMQFQIARARDYFDKSEDGISKLDASARMPVRASLDLYRKILERIEGNGFDNFRKRAYVSKLEKFMQLPLSYMKCREAAQLTGRAPAGSQ